MVRAGAFLSVIAVWGAASGCADDPPPVPSVVSFCQGVCTDAVRCGAGGGWQACYSGCMSDPQNNGLGFIRPEVAAIVGACLSQLDCQALFGNMLDSCWEKARAESTPSAHLVDFCPPYSANAFECGYWFSVEECQVRLSIWTDQFLDDLLACTREATCEATDVCLENQFGRT